MNIKLTLAILMSTTLFAAAAGLQPAYAGDKAEHSSESGMQTQSALNDAWMDGKLEASLLFNEHLNSFNIDTNVENGVAKLTGTVESDIDRDLAGEIAQSIEGISEVENELKVAPEKTGDMAKTDAAHERESFKQSVMDATLTAKVKSQLLLNSNTSGMAIDVDSANGKVTLTGKVDSAEEKELAERIAENTNGADTVINKLTVDKSGSTS